MAEQNGLTIQEQKCMNYPEAQFKSFKLIVPCLDFNNSNGSNEHLWPKM